MSHEKCNFLRSFGSIIKTCHKMETELFCKYLLERVITSPFVHFFVVEIHVFLSRKATLSSTKAKQHQKICSPAYHWKTITNVWVIQNISIVYLANCRISCMFGHLVIWMSFQTLARCQKIKNKLKFMWYLKFKWRQLLVF